MSALAVQLASLRDTYPTGSPEYATLHAALLMCERADHPMTVYHAPSSTSICSDHRHVWAYFAAAHLSSTTMLPFDAPTQHALAMADDAEERVRIITQHRREIVEGAAEWADLMTEAWKERFGQ